MGDAAQTDVLDGTVEWLDGGLELALVTGRATRPSQVYEALASVARDLMGTGSCAVMLIDSQNHLRVRGWSGAGQQLAHVINDRHPILVSEGKVVAPAVRALRCNGSIWVPHVDEDPGCAPWAAAFATEGLRSVFSVSIGTDERILGVLEFYLPTGRTP